MNARQKAKKYKKELAILKKLQVPTQGVVYYGVGDVVTYQTELIIPTYDIFKLNYTDKDICNRIIDEFREFIKENMDIKVEDCLSDKRILARLRLIKPRRGDEHITL